MRISENDSVAEPHHVDAAPVPGRNSFAAPTPFLRLILKSAKFQNFTFDVVPAPTY
jgi:hypothetical protein